MGWRDLLRKEGEATTVALPWLGGRSLRSGVRRWAIGGALPAEHGWHAFRVGGRDATWSGPADAEQIERVCSTASRSSEPRGGTGVVLREVVRGYLVGDRLVRDDARVPVDPAGLLAASERVHLVEAGLDRFTRIAAGRAYPGGELVYVGPELPLGPEAEVLAAYQEKAASLDGIRGVAPALDAAFRMESWQREATERRRLALARRRADEEEARRLEGLRRAIAGRFGDGAGRRAMARVDFAEAARAALAVGGAEYLDDRPARTRGERVVWFRLDRRRFECCCEEETLRIVDAGICLTDHDTHERGDDRFTLESLPSVIREAEREGKLVVLRHAD